MSLKTSCLATYTHLISTSFATSLKMSSESTFDPKAIVSTPHAHHESQLSTLATNLDNILFEEDVHFQVPCVSDAVGLDDSVGQVGAVAVHIHKVEEDIYPEGSLFMTSSMRKICYSSRSEQESVDA